MDSGGEVVGLLLKGLDIVVLVEDLFVELF